MPLLDDTPKHPVTPEGRIVSLYQLENVSWSKTEDLWFDDNSTRKGEVFHGEILFVVKELNKVAAENQVTSGQKFPVTRARNSLNGLPKRCHLQPIGVSPAAYSKANRNAGLSAFDCQTAGTQDMRNHEEHLQPGDRLVACIPGRTFEPKWKSEGQGSNHRGMILRKWETVMKDLWNKINQGRINDIEDRYLQRVVIDLNFPQIRRNVVTAAAAVAVAEAAGDVAALAVANQRLDLALEARDNAMATVEATVKSSEIGTAIGFSTPGEWVTVNIQM